MKTLTFRLFAACMCALLSSPLLPAQAANTAQQLVFAGLRSVGQQGQINGIKTDTTGNLYFVLDQHDGVRVFKTDAAASTILAQAQLGAAGDVGLALALDPAGNVYVTGTSTSTTLTGTPGAAIPNRTDTSTQSFVAKFDTALNPQFVTFTGGSRIAATAIAATADAVFVTGLIYGGNLPVTSNGIQQTPAPGSTQSGFVERFSASGTTLVYATYLTGANGFTSPAAIVADPADNAYLAGQTSASGFPTVAALVPAILSNPSGFLTKLDPGGDALTFSTFLPGAGLTSIALDSTGQTLLASGAVALNQFPVDTVATPLVPTTYQVLLRLPLDGSTVQSSTLIAPGTQSFVAAAPASAAWVDGIFTGPLLPLRPLADVGNGYAVRVTAQNTIDQTARFGGAATANPTYASLPTTLTSIAVDPTGQPLIAGSVQPTASASLLASETYDLPLRNAPTPAFPSAVTDAELTAQTCTGSLCAGSAAYLARLNPTSAAALSLSAADLPFVTLRNLGTATATGLTIASTAGTASSNCGSTLIAGADCNILLAAGPAGTLTVSATGTAAQTLNYPAVATPTSTIAFNPHELDFNIQTSTSATTPRTVTLTNLGTATQTFASTPPAAYFTLSSSDCTLASASTYVLAPGGTCHISILFTASTSSDGFKTASWTFANRTLALTGYSQAAALAASATELDFGEQFANGLRLPRYLYLSNSSSAPIAHATPVVPTGSPFTLTDSCLATLLPGTVCRIRVDYLSPQVPSNDTATVTLDQGLSVVLTGQTLPQPGTSGQTTNPNLSVTPTSLTFSTPVVVTGVSGTTQTVTVTNTGSTAFAVTSTITGDFTQTSSCGESLAGGQTCAIVVAFAPSQPGPRTGLLSITGGTNTTPVLVTLSGTATAILPVNNGTISSGSVPVGQPSVQFLKIAQPFTALTASTTGPYTVLLVEDIGFGPGSPSTSLFHATTTSSCHNCYLALQFLPTAVGPQPGTLTLSSATNGASYTVALSGTGLATTGLLLNPPTQDFGTVPVHSTSGAQIFTVTNLVAGGAAVTLSTPVVTGDFALTSTATGAQTCGGTLAYAASCEFALSFSPTAAGARTGTVSVSTGTTTSSATLTGTAVPDPGIALNPSTLTFANAPGATSTRQTITVTNTGSTTATVGAATTGTAAFTASSTCSTLAPNQSCTVTVTFTPAAAQTADTLSLPVTITLNGLPSTTTYTVPLTGSYTSANAGLQIVPGEAVYGPFATGTLGSSRLFTINNLTAKSLTLNVTIPRQYALIGAPCAGLAPNAGCSFTVQFVPLTNGNIPGTLYAQGTPSDGSATLNGIGYVEGYGSGLASGHGALTITGGLIVSGNYNFGTVVSGQTSTQVFTLLNGNAAGAASITVRRVTSAPPFLATTTCGSPLAPGQSCTVTVTYAPVNQVATGTTSPANSNDAGQLILESDAASAPDILTLSGQGSPIVVSSPVVSAPLATFTLSQNSLSFAATAVGNVSAAQTVTLANTGTVPIHVLGLATTTDFTVQSTCGTVLAGASCTFTVTETPQTAVTLISALEISTDAAVALEFVSLVGTGTPPPLTLTPTSLNFGSVQVGAASQLSVQVANSSGSPVVFGAITSTGDYTVSGTCPAPGGTLAGGAGCTIQVVFTPSDHRNPHRHALRRVVCFHPAPHRRAHRHRRTVEARRHPRRARLRQHRGRRLVQPDPHARQPGHRPDQQHRRHRVGRLRRHLALPGRGARTRYQLLRAGHLHTDCPRRAQRHPHHHQHRPQLSRPGPPHRHRRPARIVHPHRLAHVCHGHQRPARHLHPDPHPHRRLQRNGSPHLRAARRRPVRLLFHHTRRAHAQRSLGLCNRDDQHHHLRRWQRAAHHHRLCPAARLPAHPRPPLHPPSQETPALAPPPRPRSPLRLRRSPRSRRQHPLHPGRQLLLRRHRRLHQWRPDRQASNINPNGHSTIA